MTRPGTIHMPRIGEGTVLRQGDRLREVALEKAEQDAAPRVQLAYPRNGPWSGDNQLGYEMPFDPSAQTSQTVLKMDEWGMPTIWTVSLGVTLERELADGEFFDCIAEIYFGVGGITQRIDCDWVDGTLLCLPLNAVEVKARWNDTAQAIGLVAPAGVKVSVQLSQQSTARSRATLSKFFILEHEGESVVTSTPIPHDRIPLFAKSAQVLPFTATAAAQIYGSNFELQFFANAQTTNPLVTVPGNFLGPNVKVPIPVFARYYGLSLNGVGSTSGILTFNLLDE